jgi:hypothetical protein
MPRKPLSLDDMTLDNLPPAVPAPIPELSAHAEPEDDGWNATATVYARIPTDLYDRLRRRAFALTKGRKRVTMQDVLTTALREHLDRVGG